MQHDPDDYGPRADRGREGRRQRRLLASHAGQRLSWRLTDGEDHPVTVRTIDYNGHCPPDDRPARRRGDDEPDADQS